MRDLDLDKILNSPVPFPISEKDKTALVINFGSYRNLDETGKAEYRLAVSKTIEAMQELNQEEKSLLREAINKYLDKSEIQKLDEIEDPFDESLSPARIIPYMAGRSFKTSFVLVDSDINYMRSISEQSIDMSAAEKVTPLFTRKNEEIARYYIFQHELAHAFKEVRESGADYIAAIETLRKYPGARPLMQFTADTRIMQPVMQLLVPPDIITSYGYECSDAIRHALSLAPERLKNLKDSEVLQTAKDFQALSEANEALDFKDQPENRVRAALSEERSDMKFYEDGHSVSPAYILHTRNYGEIYRLARHVQDKENPFNPDDGNAEYGVLQDFVGAIERIAVKGYDIMPAAPAVTPSVPKPQ